MSPALSVLLGPMMFDAGRRREYCAGSIVGERIYIDREGARNVDLSLQGRVLRQAGDRNADLILASRNGEQRVLDDVLNRQTRDQRVAQCVTQSRALGCQTDARAGRDSTWICSIKSGPIVNKAQDRGGVDAS